MSCGRCSPFVTNPTSLTAAVPLCASHYLPTGASPPTDEPLTDCFCRSFCPCHCQKVRREYRKFFRAHAGKKIYDFTIQRIVSVAQVRGEMLPLVFQRRKKFHLRCPRLCALTDAEILPGPEERHVFHVAH